MSIRVCNVDGCDRPVTARGMCRMHYLREYRAGTHSARPTRANGIRPTCPPDHAHDADTCWKQHGCRCGRCVHERAMERQRRRNRLRAYGREDQIQASRVPAAPVRRHVAKLRNAGFGLERIGHAAGVGSGPMMDLWYGPRGAKRETIADLTPENELATRTIAADHAQRILAITAETIDPALHDPTGTVRQLRALVAIGWNETSLATRLGMQMGNFWTLIHGRRQRITTPTRVAVTALFTDLWDKPQTGTRADYARRIAKHYRWAGPLAWDDIDDPNEQPEGVARVRDPRPSPAEQLAEIDFLLDLGEAPDQIADILGRRADSLARFAHRHERPDIARLFENTDQRKAAA